MSAKTGKAALIISNGARNSISLDYEKLRKTVLVLRVISHPMRKKIITLIEDREKVTVTEIYVKLRLEQSVASQHLALLRKSGIVNTKRKGKFIYYTLNKKRVADIMGLVEDLALKA